MKSYIVTTFALVRHTSERSHSAHNAMGLPEIPALPEPQDTITVMAEDENFMQTSAMASLEKYLAPYGYFNLSEDFFDQTEALDMIRETFPHNPMLPRITPAILQGNRLTAKWTREWRDMLQFLRNKSS